MPELPEVETVMRGLAPVLVGRRIAHVDIRREGLRFPFPTDFAGRLLDRKIIGLTRRAKYILVTLDDTQIFLVHLGMTGRFTIAGEKMKALGEFYHPSQTADTGVGTHDHVVISLDDGTRVIYTDPRRFGIMDMLHDNERSTHKLLKDIGVEPLGNGFNGVYLAEKFTDKKTPLKAALLDQRIIAGLGNIYVSEALHRTGLSPKRKAGTLARKAEQLDSLARHIRDILNEAIRAGGSTLQDFASTNGQEGSYQQRFAVYDRANEPCQRPGCGGTIHRIVQSGRSTFYCKQCQK